MSSSVLNIFDPPELVIDKKDTDDEKLPEIIPITKEEPKAEKQNLWAIHEKDLKVCCLEMSIDFRTKLLQTFQ